MRWLVIDRLSFKLGVSVALLLLAGLAAGFYMMYQAYWEHVLAITRERAVSETRLIRMALEHEMMANERTLIEKMVGSFAARAPIERVLILDRGGDVGFTSDPDIRRQHFADSDPACLACHQLPPDQRAGTITLEMEDDAVLRCVEPIPNAPRCHTCHPASQSINGVLIVDVSLGQTRDAVEGNITRLALGIGAIGLVLLGGIGFILRRLVLRRLARFRRAAKAISEGDLERRVEVQGTDALAGVESQFNRMADAVSELLGQVQDQRAYLERVIDSVDDGLVVLDRQHRVVAANQAFARRFGADPAELVGRACCVEQGGEASLCVGDGECPTERCFAEQTVHMALRTRATEQGAVRQEEVRASPIFGADGQVLHCVEIWRDITDRRTAEAKLADYQRLASMGMLAAGFSHELNTPLASVRTCLDGVARLLAAEGDLDGRRGAELGELTRIAGEQIQRCGAITQQFLQMARGGGLSREVVDPAAVAAQVVELVGPTAKQAGVEISLRVRAGETAAIADPSALQQVLMNLLLNAIEASQSGQAVEVEVGSAPDQGAALRVIDHGRGIQPADRAHVFEPFFSRREGGSGLGLFLALNLVRRWGGDIQVQSEPGQGAQFTISLAGPSEGG